jgi:hypothetical protein
MKCRVASQNSTYGAKWTRDFLRITDLILTRESRPKMIGFNKILRRPSKRRV